MNMSHVGRDPGQRALDTIKSSPGFAASGFLVAILGVLLAKLEPTKFSFTGLFLRYQELGFVKRGLFGTLISPLIPNQINQGEARLIILALGLTAILAICVLATFLRKNNSSLLSLIALTSPAFFMQMGYTFAFLDLWCLITLLLTIYVVSRLPPSRQTITIVILLGLIGPFFHEIYLLAFFPVAFAVSLLHSKKYAAALAISACVAAAIIATYGSFEPGPESLASLIQGHYSSPIDLTTFELTSSLKKNVFSTIKLVFATPLFTLSYMPGILYLGLLFSAFQDHPKPTTSTLQLSPWLAALSPLLLNVLGGDPSRWFGMACFNLIILALAGYLSLKPISKAKAYVLFLFFFLGPIGISASFPIVYYKVVNFLS